MADLGWFSFRPRSRTPVVPNASSLSDGGSYQETDDQRRPKPTRVSSHISLSSHFSFSPEPSPTSTSTRASIHINDGDQVWHNPSSIQIIEALQVIMMTKEALDPIPIEYNAYILRLLESFRDAKDNIEAINAARKEAQESRDRLEQDFKTVTNEWARRETQYKAEVKRLEVILARTSRDGLQTVTLARTNSVVDRGGPDPRQFVTKLQNLRCQDRHSEPGSDLDRCNEYNAVLGERPLTDRDVMKTLRYIHDSDQSSDTSGSEIKCKSHIICLHVKNFWLNLVSACAKHT